jgi:hypothetical protein
MTRHTKFAILFLVSLIFGLGCLAYVFILFPPPLAPENRPYVMLPLAASSFIIVLSAGFLERLWRQAYRELYLRWCSRRFRMEITTYNTIADDTTGQLVGAVVERTSEGRKRIYHVTFAEDSPEREEAVHFFLGKNPRSLFPAMGVPRELEGMDEEAAGEWLATHPIPRQWTSLSIYAENDVTDVDLARLKHIPELQTIKIWSSRISDAGVMHLTTLPALKDLFLYSPLVTDASLGVIVRITSLRLLDMQLCPNVSPAAFEAAMKIAHWVYDKWPPLPKETSMEVWNRAQPRSNDPPEGLLPRT